MTTSSFPIDEVSAALAQARQQWRQAHQRTQEPGGREFPSRDALAQVVAQLGVSTKVIRVGLTTFAPTGTRSAWSTSGCTVRSPPTN